MHNKRVLVILDNGFDPDVRIYKEMCYLASRGFEVTIYSWDREGRHIDKPEEICNGIKIVRFFINSIYGSGLKQIGAFLKFAMDCRKAMYKERPFDYIHCSDLSGIVIGVLSGAQHRMHSKLIFDMKEFYEAGSLKPIRPLAHLVIAQMQNKCDWIIYLNERQKKEISQKNLKKLVYIPNYPPRSLCPVCEKEPCNKLRISFMGFVRHKEQLKALIDVGAQHQNNVEVFIHGNGALYTFFSEYTRGISNCHVTGKYDYENIGTLYRHTDLIYFVYDCDDENDKHSYPTKFFEAIITNTPMIVADHTLHGEYCKKNNIGFCISKSYERDLEEVVQRILMDRQQLVAMANQEKMIEHLFLWEHVVEELNLIYS